MLKNLRYKDYQLLKKERIDVSRLNLAVGTVTALTSLKDFAAFLSQDDALYQWWRTNMGFPTDGKS